jgi:hypothetical protein
MIKALLNTWLPRLGILAFFIPTIVGPYWYFQDPGTIYYSRKIVTPIVAPGENIVIQIRSVSHRECPSTVKRTIVDSEGYEYTKVDEDRSTVGQYDVSLTIPLGAFSGPATYVATVMRRCNPLQEVFPSTVQQPPLGFVIRKLETQMQLPEQQGIYTEPQIPFGPEAPEYLKKPGDQR